MRVIAGSLKGRQFRSPRSRRTHPMSDRVRGALFNVLGPIEGLSLLDAFAGTGAISIEAISRGARAVTAVEIDRKAQVVIADNIAQLDITAIQLYRGSANSWMGNYPEASDFDIVVLDPPYTDINLTLIERLAARARSGGLIVLSWPGHEELPALKGCALRQFKSYGDAQLAFYRLG